jgi:hypothetical protein
VVTKHEPYGETYHVAWVLYTETAGDVPSALEYARDWDENEIPGLVLTSLVEEYASWPKEQYSSHNGQRKIGLVEIDAVVGHGGCWI